MAEEPPRTIDCPICFKTRQSVFVSICSNKHYVCADCAESMCCRKVTIPTLKGTAIVTIGNPVHCPLCRGGLVSFEEIATGNGDSSDAWVGEFDYPRGVNGSVMFRDQRFACREGAIEYWLENPRMTYECYCCGATSKQAPRDDGLPTWTGWCSCLMCWDCNEVFHADRDALSHLITVHKFPANTRFQRNSRRTRQTLSRT